MKKETRASVAYIALRLATGLKKSSVYDYSEGEYITIDGKVSVDNVDVYDYEIGCHVSGRSRNGQFDLYHYGNGNSIELKMKDNKFEGYDYDVSNHFSGTVSGKSLSLYDYEHSKYYDYSF
ncbi:hypothetical protein ABE65_011485 [Fictibacillus phosphorivorans]|uniref:Uncharacterized protein n=1 Tax=Fictibacillus phosphorivorans TaxID=1221500 RepID=A0A168W1A5_9BACL|nr:hypothetical protein [Fictibacillus phosphorivorans]ANC77389.1 hypothetical protein ABE65_011485 [Fictibacillus phosphorivorans]